MTKPADIPQDVWDYAQSVEMVWRDMPPPEAIEHHARAILAEREACAAIADDYQVIDQMQPHLPASANLSCAVGQNEAAELIAAAIRKRGEA